MEDEVDEIMNATQRKTKMPILSLSKRKKACDWEKISVGKEAPVCRICLDDNDEI